MPVKTYGAAAGAGADIPDEFDSYKQWPNFTHPIRDQAPIFPQPAGPWLEI